jgi:hypothetical protein
MITSHLVGQPEIELTGRDTAKGTWALQDLVIIEEQGIEIRGTAFYEDAYVKGPDGWRFSHTGYRRVYEEMGPRQDGTKITATWSTGGASSIAPKR